MADLKRALDRFLRRGEQFLSTFFGLAEKECSLLLGRPIKFSNPRGRFVATTCLEAELPAEGVVVRFAGPAVPAELLLALPLGDALTLSGLLLGLPEGTLGEKVARREVTPMDTDAFAEIGNQLGGFLNRVIQDLGRSGTHVKQEGTDIRGAGAAPMPLHEGQYLHGRAELIIRGFDPGSVHLLVPAGACEAVMKVAVPSETTDAALASPPEVAASRAAVLLLYETDEDCRTIQEALAAHHIAVVSAPAAQDAFKALGTRRFDCVVIESGQPGPGILTCDRIRTGLGPGAPPAIVCASAWTEAHLRTALQAGVRDILAKPLNPRRLAERLDAFLDGQAAGMVTARSRR